MKRIFFLTLITLLFFVACKKEDNTPTPTPDPTPVVQGAAYYPLKKGNYWIYEQYRKNANEIDYKPTGKLDSVYVLGDSTISGQTYKVVKVPYFNTLVEQYRRSESEKVFNFTQQIFSSTNFSTPIFEYLSYQDATTKKDTNQYNKILMKKANSISVPAGEFDTYVAEAYNYWGKTAQRAAFSTNYGTRYFAKGVGIVKEIVGHEKYAEPNPPYVIEWRLVRYKLL